MKPRLRIVFAGTPEFSVPALDALHAAGHELVAVYTQPDRPACRGRAVAAGPVKTRALELGLRVEQPATLRTPEAIAQLAALEPDLVVVVAYGLILPQGILEVPDLGCLNIHASLLPRWRGAAPIHRAILAGDARTGITIMKMEAGLDTGPVLLTRSTGIGARETVGSLHDRLAALGAEAIVVAIDEWRSGRVRPVPQPEEGVTYAAKIRKEEATIDWSRPADEIGRQVRAFNPWPVAETRWDGHQLRIWEAEALPGDAGAEPGRVVEARHGRIVVATGSGALKLGQVQLAGRRVTGAAEFLNAHSLADARFG
ncbi:MAG: methionyl-tRNA formyltransferase [Steroidobacteraceae bacterium]